MTSLRFPRRGPPMFFGGRPGAALTRCLRIPSGTGLDGILHTGEELIYA
jgi:hypothetical protein